MSEAILQRLEDPSGVSGVGAVAEIFEATDGAVAIRWKGAHPSWGLWPDMRDLEAIHGHDGKSLVQYLEPDRLTKAYQQVCFWLTKRMNPDRLPLTLGPHPDWPDRLLMRVEPTALNFWIALFDGSPSACTHEEVRGEIVTTWISADGNLWLQSKNTGTWEDLLAGETYEDPEDAQ